MKKRIICGLLAALMCVLLLLTLGMTAFAADEDADTAAETETAEPADTAKALSIKSAVLDDGKLTITVAAKQAKSDDEDDETGTETQAVENAILFITNYDQDKLTFSDNDYYTSGYSTYLCGQLGDMGPGTTKTVVFHVETEEKAPVIDVGLQYVLGGDEKDAGISYEAQTFKNILKQEDAPTKLEVVKNFLNQTGFSLLVRNWKQIVMLLIAFVLIFLAIVKKFEPLLLLPIAFGMLLTNLPGAEMFHEQLFANGHVHWELFTATENFTPGLVDYLYLGVKLGIYPCLIFLGVGAMTDFGPLIANPKSLLLGAAAQLGIFVTYVASRLIGFTTAEAASIGIIGGADGPTAIYVTTRLAPWLLGPIAVAAYSYMALVPVIQPPIMKALTTKKERMIVMKPLREVSKREKILFPIVVTVFVALLVPSAAPLVGCLMLGNLFRESGVVERLSKCVQNELNNIVVIFLGVSVGATATAATFLSLETLEIILMGVVAFGLGTAGGVLLAKFMNLFLKNKINPLIGSAGVSAVPMAARVSQTVGQKENPKNFLLMHAMGPNVAGVIGSAIAAGVLIALFS